MDASEFLTSEQAQEYLGVKRPTLYKYIKQGKLRVYKSGVGYRSYFLKAELDDLKQIRPFEPREASAAA